METNRKLGKSGNELKLDMSPMIDVTFLLIIYFIVSMQMEPSLDNIIKLPPILNAAKQDDALLQIYVLPANILPGGFIDPDSTGLIAFSDKAKTPNNCPSCNVALKDKGDVYLINSLMDHNKKPLVDLKGAMAATYTTGGKPPAFNCVACGAEVSPYLKLDEIPRVLKAKKKEVFALMVRQKNTERKKMNKPPMSEPELKEFEKQVPLMIKADSKAFYGRILQVVNMAKDTASDIQSFAFITLPDASKEAQMQKEKKLQGK